MTTQQRENVLNKIRALMRKTIEAGCTESEALAALSMAQAMRDAHAVTEAELNLSKEEKAILRREPPGTKDPHRIKWLLSGAVSKFCNCEGWRRNRAVGGGLVFCGLPSDAQFATWLLDALTNFVLGEITNFLMEAEPDGEDRREAIRSFVLGITDRINDRLIELCKQSAVHATSNGKALVAVKDAAIKAKLDELGIHFRCGSAPCGAGDSSSYGAGRAAGDRASFGRPVSGRNATLRLK